MRLVPIFVLVAALVPPGPGAAADPVLAGDICHQDLVVYGDQWSGAVAGGPIAAADVSTVSPSPVDVVLDNPVTITLTCSVKRGLFVYHSDPDVLTVSATGSGVAVVPPTPVTFSDPDESAAYWVCTSVTVTDRDGHTQHLYWDTTEDEFSLDVTAYCGPVACPLSSRSSCDGVRELIGRVFEEADRAVVEHVDPVICEQFRHAPDQPGVVETGPDGDLYVAGEFFWDCAPYV